MTQFGNAPPARTLTSRFSSKLKSMFKGGIRTKLIVIMLLVGVIPISTSTLISSIRTSDAFETNWKSSGEAINKMKYDYISAWLSERKSDISVISRTNRIKTASGILNDGTSDSNAISGSRTQIEAVLQEYINLYGVYEMIYTLYPNGTTSAFSLRDDITSVMNIGIDLSSRTYYTLCYANRENPQYQFLSDFIVNQDGDPMLTVAHSIYSDDDNEVFAGIIVAILDLDDFNTLMHDATGLGDTGESYLVNEDFYWVTTSKFDYYVENDPDISTVEETLLVKQITQEGAQLAVAGKTQVTTINDDYRGIAVIGVYNYFDLTTEDGKGWILITEIDVSEALKTSNEVITLSIVILGIAVFLICLIAILYARSLANPISELVNASQKISGGDYNIQVREIEGKDEISDLIEHLGVMKDNIVEKLEYNRLIIDISPNPQILLNEDYHILDLNPMVLKVTGFTKEELMGKSVSMVFKNSSQYEESAAMLKRDKRVINYEMIPKTQNSDIYHMLLNIEQMIDTNGKLVGNLLTFTDISNVRNLVEIVQNIAQEVNTMADQIAESSNQINLSIQEVTGGTQEVAKGAQYQSKAVEDITQAVKMVQDLSQNIVKETHNIAEQSQAGQGMADKGKGLTDNLLVRINEINEGAENVADTMTSLEQKSKEINKIVEVIAGIATETNLLALNAAIEAARAGDAGKGFAVVAEQVRKLAEDSKQAADQINDLIKAIQSEVNEAVNSTNSTVVSIKDGKTALEGTKVQLDALFNVIEATDAGIRLTIENINNQDSHIGQIAENVESINSVIQQSSGTAQELSSSSEEMASTLEEMSAAAEELNAASNRLFEEIQKI
ncbi:methyl-accepting chemotaxis protein [Candidatus Lokiarchaeum ossiferum]|uniref:methyl-accepting chemotaxis protein n=1 Tax=Candidatus Lokiarchaeum ossiferum TaxID=2951803 RepID=UPI00352DC054